MKFLLIIISSILCTKLFGFPFSSDRLNSISSGPQLSDCEHECEHQPDVQLFKLNSELKNNNQVISILSRPYFSQKILEPDRFSITVDIPAYDGKNPEQVRVDVTPFDLNNFFLITKTNIQSYRTTKDLEYNILYQERINLGEEPSDSFKHQVKEQMDILDFTSLVKDGKMSAANNLLQSRYGNATTEEKISFLGSLLSRLSQNYDSSRLSDGFGAKTISNKELATAILLNNDGLINPGAENLKAGVCRHMHQFAVRVAREIGLNLSFGVSYPVSTGYHLSMVATDPDNPGRTYKLNYGNLKKVDGVQGQMVLDVNYHELVSNGIGFHLWGKDQQPIYFSPSERGLTLSQMAGEDLKDFDVNVRPTAKKVIGALKFSGNNIRVFHSMSNEGNGEHLSGASVARKIKFNKFISGDYGLVAYHARKESDSGEFQNFLPLDDKRVTTSSGLYFYIGNDFHANIVEKNELELKIFTRINLRGTVFFSRSTIFDNTEFEQNTNTFLFDGNGQIISGLSSTFGNKFRLTGLADISGQSNDINDMTGFTLYARRFSLISDFTVPISGNLAVSNSSNLNLYPLDGNNILTAASHLSFGTISGDRSIQIGVLYPLQDISPSFIPGSRTTVEASIRATFFKEMLGVTINGYYAPEMFTGVADVKTQEDTSMKEGDFRGPGRAVSPATPADFGIGVTIDGSL